jgi:hypothetical protein
MIYNSKNTRLTKIGAKTEGFEPYIGFNIPLPP